MGIISEKKEKMKSCSVFQIEQKMELVICFLRYSFGRKKVILTVVEGEYTPDNPIKPDRFVLLIN